MRHGTGRPRRRRPRAGGDHLVDLAPLAAWRGRGIGTALVGSMIGEAEAAGRPIRLHVRSDDERARRLHGRLGFAAGETTPTDVATRWTPVAKA